MKRDNSVAIDSTTIDLLPIDVEHLIGIMIIRAINMDYRCVRTDRVWINRN